MTPAELAATVARASRVPRAARTLLLDLDGTLAPIARTPDEAVVPEPALDAVRRLLRGGWRIAVVSGRPAKEVRRMVPVRGVCVFGSHGLEGSWDGRGAEHTDPELGRRLELLVRAARRIARPHPGVLVERKPAGVAFHDRGMERKELRAWRRRRDSWLAERDLAGLEAIPGKRVLEIRPEGFDKGHVVRSLPATGPRGRDRSLVAIGDDRTDEDMFRALGSRGLSVRVGRSTKETAADVHLPSPSAVLDFLQRLAASGPAPARRLRGRGPSA